MSGNFVKGKQDCAAGQEAREGMSAMRENQKGGPQQDSQARPRKAIVSLAADTFCIVCGGQPCFMLTTAATTAIQERLMYDEDLTSVGRYIQDLERLQQCLTRHRENAEYMLRRYSAEKGATSNHKAQMAGTANLQNIHNGDPPTPIYN